MLKAKALKTEGQPELMEAVELRPDDTRIASLAAASYDTASFNKTVFRHIMLIFLLFQIPLSVTGSIFEICLCLALVGFFWAIGEAFRQGWANLQRLHQIPCSRCIFYTGDYRLKCTVYPDTALSEDAIDCLDYELALTSPRAEATRISSKEL